MPGPTSVLTTDEFAQRAAASDAIIMDVRPLAAYNGWRLRGESRGGHVPGAKSVPLFWTRYMDWVEVLEEKHISPDRPVVVYGYDASDAHDMATRLADLGYEDVAVYNTFVDEWAADEGRPLEHLARYEQLVYPEWVHDLITGKKPPTYRGDDFVVCHVHFDNYADYLKDHIPGAISLDTLLLEDERTWNRRTPEELRKALTGLGIRHDTTVVVYGRFAFPTNEHPHPGQQAGQLGAMRAAAILLYAGVQDVRILNGGFTTWQSAGLPVERTVNNPHPVEDFGADIPGRPELFIDTPEAKQILASDDGFLVSVRSWEEFIGNVSGYHYIEKKGRIPGAVFGNCGSDAYHMENYRNFDYTMREYPEVEAAWAEMGITRDKRVAFYCGTGWRGSEAFLNAYLMGWPDVSVYDGGWMEWSSDPSNPIETGEPATARRVSERAA